MPTNRRTRRLRAAVTSVACVAAFASGCSGAATNSASSLPAAGSTSPVIVDTTGGQASDTTGSSATVTPAGANAWFPLVPGYQSVRLGSLNRGHTNLEHQRVFTVTNVTKMIDGIRATLVIDQDFDGGEIAETALDYLAVDADGNILYLGSYTEAYEAGVFVNAADAWLAGVNGSRGMLLPGDPQSAGQFTQVDVPGQETSTAEFVEIVPSVCVPFGCYTDVLVIREGPELKYFALGVGGIKTEPDYSGGEQEKEELINLTQLSSQSLAEISAEALRLDEHARETSPDVFGNSARAEQTS